MATDQATADFIADQAKSAGMVRTRKMFGEYALYCDGKVVGLICDGRLYVKFTDAGRAFARGRYSEGTAYPGARPSMDVTDGLDDAGFIGELIRQTAAALPQRPSIRRKPSSR